MDEMDRKRAIVEELRPKLDELRGGKAHIWHLRQSHSVLVVRIVMPRWTTHRAYLDCLSCTRVSFVPAWEPVRFDLQFVPDLPLAPLVLSDNDFRVECQSCGLDRLDDANLSLPGPSGLRTHFDLFDRISSDPSIKTFSQFATFLDGYETSLADNLIVWNAREPHLYQFQDWLKAKFDATDLSCGWRHVITMNHPDDHDAYKAFLQLLAEFRENSASDPSD